MKRELENEEVSRMRAMGMDSNIMSEARRA
jgi:hypothetical protein